MVVKRKQARGASIIVVTYWTGEILRESFKSFKSQKGVDEIIFVDNGNPASVREWLDCIADKHDNVQVIRPGRNTGFAAGCNLGAANARSDFIALVNPDCVLRRNTISKAVSVLCKDESAWLCGGCLQGPDGREQRGSRRETLTPWRACVELLRLDRVAPNHPYFRRFHQFDSGAIKGVKEVPTVSGAFMVIRKNAYERVGGMDENLFLHLDDSDLCMRMAELGGKILFCGNLPITHHLSTSDVSRTFIEWHKARGMTYFFYKHFNNAYPYWFLNFVSLLVWLRFGLLLPIQFARDVPEMIRRRRRRFLLGG